MGFFYFYQKQNKTKQKSNEMIYNVLFTFFQCGFIKT
jgi:hypothetical protein